MGTTSNTVTKLTTAAAKKHTDNIRNLLEASHGDLIEAGYMLDDFFANNWHKVLGYENQKDFVEKALDISYTHAARLKSIARYAYELGYTMEQVQAIYKRTGHLSALRFYLYNLTEKRPVNEAVKTLRQEGYHDRDGCQFNIMLKERDAKQLNKVLSELGMDTHEASGRRVGVSEAMVALTKIGKQTLKL